MDARNRGEPAGQWSASVLESATFAKVTKRLIPLLFIGYFIAFLDRVNVGFAKLQMADDLQFSDAVYGFGAGIFFLGYFLFEVPSNLLLKKVGARVWIARIMITWGVLSSAFMLVGYLRWGQIATAVGLTDAQFSFYFLRFLLGAAEAGFYPGVILYLTFWFPAARRANVIALFMTAIAFSNVVGSPLSGAIMQHMDGALDWRGWQWLFLLEGSPAIFVGLVVLIALPDGPHSAHWLNDEERAFISERLAADERARSVRGQRHDMAEIFLDFRIWIFTLAYFCLNAGLYALNFWIPTIIQEFGVNPKDFMAVGLIAMIPWGVAAISMVICAKHSDRTGERRRHATFSALAAAVGLLLLALFGDSVAWSLIGLSMVASGTLSWLSVSWSYPMSFLSGTAAAGGIALINSFANLGGYFGPDLIGRIRDANGGDSTAAFLALSAAALLSAALTYSVASIRKEAAAKMA